MLLLKKSNSATSSSGNYWPTRRSGIKQFGKHWPDTIYLNKNEVVAINHNQIALFGGNFVPPANFLHEENLDYLAEAIQAEMFGEPLYPQIHQKAGVYFFSVICNHIFQDGNKRTGLEAALLFLQLNGHDLVVGDDLLTNFTLSVAVAGRGAGVVSGTHHGVVG